MATPMKRAEWMEVFQEAMQKYWKDIYRMFDDEIPNLRPTRTAINRRSRMEAALKEKYTHETYAISFDLADDGDGTDKPGVENG